MIVFNRRPEFKRPRVSVYRKNTFTWFALGVFGFVVCGVKWFFVISIILQALIECVGGSTSASLNRRIWFVLFGVLGLTAMLIFLGIYLRVLSLG